MVILKCNKNVQFQITPCHFSHLYFKAGKIRPLNGGPSCRITESRWFGQKQYTGVGQIWLSWGFRKAGRVWCGGARKTQWATCHNRVTPTKTKEFLKSPRFFRSSWENIKKSKIGLESFHVYFSTLFNKNCLKSFLVCKTNRNSFYKQFW